jgi:hypothetical protein
VGVRIVSLGARQVFRGPTGRWVDAVCQSITGLDATRRFFANHSAEIDGHRRLMGIAYRKARDAV